MCVCEDTQPLHGCRAVLVCRTAATQTWPCPLATSFTHWTLAQRRKQLPRVLSWRRRCWPLRTCAAEASPGVTVRPRLPEAVLYQPPRLKQAASETSPWAAPLRRATSWMNCWSRAATQFDRDVIVLAGSAGRCCKAVLTQQPIYCCLVRPLPAAAALLWPLTGDLALLYESWWKTRRSIIWKIAPDRRGEEKKVLFDR